MGIRIISFYITTLVLLPVLNENILCVESDDFYNL